MTSPATSTPFTSRSTSPTRQLAAVGQPIRAVRSGPSAPAGAPTPATITIEVQVSAEDARRLTDLAGRLGSTVAALAARELNGRAGTDVRTNVSVRRRSTGHPDGIRHGVTRAPEPPNSAVPTDPGLAANSGAPTNSAPVVAAVRPVPAVSSTGTAASAAPSGETANAGANTGANTEADNVPRAVVDLPRREVRVRGRSVRLTRLEFDLLAFLIRNHRQVFTRAQLLTSVWGYEVPAGERTVDVHVRRLRAKLSDTGVGITTVHGVGYRLESARGISVVDAISTPA